MLIVSYDWMLVVASVLMAHLAAFTGLRLSSGLAALSPEQRKPQIVKSAIALGGGIWSMHFIGMLAMKISVAIEYDALYTLGSALVAILITGLGLGLLHFGRRTRNRIVMAGVAMGLGIVSMHYIGMSAIRGNCLVSYNPTGIFLSMVVAIVASTGALWLAYKRRTTGDLVLGTVALGMSISAMHYTAMVYTGFAPAIDLVVVPDPVLSSGVLAMVVALSSFLICGFFLLTAIPGTSEPEPASMASLKTTEIPADSSALPFDRLPYETRDSTRFIALTDVFAIKAEGHYTRLLVGQGEHFCPLSISTIESRLKDHKFLKIHRSYLVNLMHVSGIQRAGDRASCLLDDAAASQVPVSRARVQDFCRALGLKNTSQGRLLTPENRIS